VRLQVAEGTHTPDLMAALGAPAASTEEVATELLGRIERLAARGTS